MTNLIDKLERADGPDREMDLDQLLAEALHALRSARAYIQNATGTGNHHRNVTIAQLEAALRARSQGGE